MSKHSLPYLANCSLLFTEEPLLRRPAAAHAAGFSAVEFWWPFPVPVPSDREVDTFTASIADAGVVLVGLNFFAGDLAGPDCGVTSIPSRSTEFRDNIDVAVGIGERMGVRGFNALYGNRVPGVDPEAQDELAVENITLAANAAAGIGATVLIEPVSGPKPYPLRRADDAVAVVERVRAAGAANVGFLCDLYHLASNGDDVSAAITAHADVTSHVQIADAPGRGEPGSGELDLDHYLAALQDHGYHGWVSLEYKPTSTTEASLAWLPRARRAAAANTARPCGGTGEPVLGMSADLGSGEVEVVQADVGWIAPGARGELQVHVVGACHLGDVRRDRLPGTPAARVAYREGSDGGVGRIVEHDLHEPADASGRARRASGVELGGPVPEVDVGVLQIVAVGQLCGLVAIHARRVGVGGRRDGDRAAAAREAVRGDV